MPDKMFHGEWWIVVASVVREVKAEGITFDANVNLPSFYLNGAVQKIHNTDDAKAVVREILNLNGDKVEGKDYWLGVSGPHPL